MILKNKSKSADKENINNKVNNIDSFGHGKADARGMPAYDILYFEIDNIIQDSG